MATWRPHFHYTPEANWLSDPNGLVWHKDQWHLYYQHNPLGDKWGHMSWGHAVSKDLITWQELPVAISENEHHMIYSGSAVIGSDGNIVAAYTGATRSQPGNQSQYLVKSENDGASFSLASEPAIDEDRSDFRDPKLFWHRETGQWKMVSVRANSNCAVIYGSDDLQEWTLLSQIGPFDLPGQIWECPELMNLPIEDGGHRWWFKVDLLEVDDHHLGSGAIAMTGHFDGKNFLPDGHVNRNPYWQWVDHGRDFYAAVGWNGGPAGDNARYWIGWMGNHRYQADLPSTGWCGAMSLVRTLQLRENDGRWQLVQRPVVDKAGFEQVVAKREFSLSLDEKYILGSGLSRALSVGLSLYSGTINLIIRSVSSDLVVKLDIPNRQIILDRSQCGTLNDHDDFCRPMIAEWQSPKIGIEIWIDDHSIEIFADSGATVLTAQTFHSPGPLQLILVGDAEMSDVSNVAVGTLKTTDEGKCNVITTDCG